MANRKEEVRVELFGVSFEDVVDEDLGVETLEGVDVRACSVLKSVRDRPKRGGRLVGLTCFVFANEGPREGEVNFG